MTSTTPAATGTGMYEAADSHNSEPYASASPFFAFRYGGQVPTLGVMTTSSDRCGVWKHTMPIADSFTQSCGYSHQCNQIPQQNGNTNNFQCGVDNNDNNFNLLTGNTVLVTIFVCLVFSGVGPSSFSVITRKLGRMLNDFGYKTSRLLHLFITTAITGSWFSTTGYSREHQHLPNNSVLSAVARYFCSSSTSIQTSSSATSPSVGGSLGQRRNGTNAFGLQGNSQAGGHQNHYDSNGVNSSNNHQHNDVFYYGNSNQNAPGVNSSVGSGGGSRNLRSKHYGRGKIANSAQGGYHTADARMSPSNQFFNPLQSESKVFWPYQWMKIVYEYSRRTSQGLRCWLKDRNSENSRRIVWWCIGRDDLATAQVRQSSMADSVSTKYGRSLNAYISSWLYNFPFLAQIVHFLRRTGLLATQVDSQNGIRSPINLNEQSFQARRDCIVQPKKRTGHPKKNSSRSVAAGIGSSSSQVYHRVTTGRMQNRTSPHPLNSHDLSDGSREIETGKPSDKGSDGPVVTSKQFQGKKNELYFGDVEALDEVTQPEQHSKDCQLSGENARSEDGDKSKGNDTERAKLSDKAEITLSISQPEPTKQFLPTCSPSCTENEATQGGEKVEIVLTDGTSGLLHKKKRATCRKSLSLSSNLSLPESKSPLRIKCASEELHMNLKRVVTSSSDILPITAKYIVDSQLSKALGSGISRAGSAEIKAQKVAMDCKAFKNDLRNRTSVAAPATELLASAVPFFSSFSSRSTSSTFGCSSSAVDSRSSFADSLGEHHEFSQDSARTSQLNAFEEYPNKLYSEPASNNPLNLRIPPPPPPPPPPLPEIRSRETSQLSSKVRGAGYQRTSAINSGVLPAPPHAPSLSGFMPNDAVSWPMFNYDAPGKFPLNFKFGASSLRDSFEASLHGMPSSATSMDGNWGPRSAPCTARGSPPPNRYGTCPAGSQIGSSLTFHQMNANYGSHFPSEVEENQIYGLGCNNSSSFGEDGTVTGPTFLLSFAVDGGDEMSPLDRDANAFRLRGDEAFWKPMPPERASSSSYPDNNNKPPGFQFQQVDSDVKLMSHSCSVGSGLSSGAFSIRNSGCYNFADTATISSFIPASLKQHHSFGDDATITKNIAERDPLLSIDSCSQQLRRVDDALPAPPGLVKLPHYLLQHNFS